MVRVKRPPERVPVESPCKRSKSGKHHLVVLENPANTDTYTAKCRDCGRILLRPND